jgi:fructokinase
VNQPTTSNAPHIDAVCLGEIILDMFAAETGRSHEQVSAYLPVPGGAPANVAVGISRQGFHPAFIGKVGDDAFGRRMRAALSAEGVDVRGLCADTFARTTLNFIALPDANSADFLFYRNPGADERLEPTDLDRDLIEGARAFHCSSFALAVEPLRSAALEALYFAHRAGRLVSFDVNYRASVWPSPDAARKEVFALLPKVDVLKVNEDEAALLTGETEIEKAAACLDGRGPALIVITLGPKGCYFHTSAASGYVPGFPVQTVDASGCGDTFIAGMLCGLLAAPDWRNQLDRYRLAALLRRANAAGALTSTKKGVIPAIPTAAEVDTFIASADALRK